MIVLAIATELFVLNPSPFRTTLVLAAWLDVLGYKYVRADETLGGHQPRWLP